MIEDRPTVDALTLSDFLVSQTKYASPNTAFGDGKKAAYAEIQLAFPILITIARHREKLVDASGNKL